MDLGTSVQFKALPQPKVLLDLDKVPMRPSQRQHQGLDLPRLHSIVAVSASIRKLRLARTLKWDLRIVVLLIISPLHPLNNHFAPRLPTPYKVAPLLVLRRDSIDL